jgi:hypothetical protein
LALRREAEAEEQKFPFKDFDPYNPKADQLLQLAGGTNATIDLLHSSTQEAMKLRTVLASRVSDFCNLAIIFTPHACYNQFKALYLKNEYERQAEEKAVQEGKRKPKKFYKNYIAPLFDTSYHSDSDEEFIIAKENK